MNGFDARDAHRYIFSRIDQKAFGAIRTEISAILDAFLQSDLRFMRVTGVLDGNDDRGDQEYDEDEAFEFILDAYVSDTRCDDGIAMVVATLLDRYMELQYEYLKSHGFAED